VYFELFKLNASLFNQTRSTNSNALANVKQINMYGFLPGVCRHTISPICPHFHTVEETAENLLLSRPTLTVECQRLFGECTDITDT